MSIPEARKTKEDHDIDEIVKKTKKLEIRRQIDEIWVTNNEEENGADLSSHWNLPLLREFESHPEKLGHIDFVQKLLMLVEPAYYCMDMRVKTLVTSVLKKAYYCLSKSSHRLVIMEYYYQTCGTKSFVSCNEEFRSSWLSLLNNKITSSVEEKEYAAELADEVSWFCMMDLWTVLWESFVLAVRNLEALRAIVMLLSFLKPIGLVINSDTGNLFIMDTIKQLIPEEIVKPKSQTAENFVQLISRLCRTQSNALDMDSNALEERFPLVHPNDVIHQLIIPGMKKVEWRGMYISLLIQLISNVSTKIDYDSDVNVPPTTGVQKMKFEELQAATKMVETKKEYWEIRKRDVAPKPRQPGTMERIRSGSKSPKWIVPSSANDKRDKPPTVTKVRLVKKVEFGPLLIMFVGYMEMERVIGVKTSKTGGIGIPNSGTNASQLTKACKALTAEIGNEKLEVCPEAMRQLDERLSKLTGWQVKFLLLDTIPEWILAASDIKAQVPECLLKRTSRETQKMFQAIPCCDNGKRHAERDCVLLSLLELVTVDGSEHVLWLIEQGEMDLRNLQFKERWVSTMTKFLLRWRPEHMQGMLKVLAAFGIEPDFQDCSVGPSETIPGASTDVIPFLTLTDALVLALSTHEQMGWSWRACELVIGQYCVAAKDWMENVVKNAVGRGGTLSEKSILVILDEIEEIISNILSTYNEVFADRNLPNNLLILQTAVGERKRALVWTGTNVRKRYEAAN